MSSRERMQKKAPKTSVKLDIELNEEQKKAIEVVRSNTITYINGKAGSGKTLTGIYAALSALHKCEINEIVISRPAVTAKEDLGFLPGGIDEKMDPFMIPIFDNLKKVYSKKEQSSGNLMIEKYIEQGEIKIRPISHLRGLTFENAYVVMDEAQNLTEEQLIMVLTRVGKNCKLIFTGDLAQCDLKRNCHSGLNLLQSLIKRGNVKQLTEVDLLQNHRDPIVASLLDDIDLIQKTKA